MERSLILIFIAAVIGMGIYAGVTGVLVGSHDTWSPRDYVVKGGECWVHPQGDPLYDEHYARNVNLPNCEAYEAQEKAQYTEAQARQIDWYTDQGKIGVYVILFVVVGIMALLFIAVIRG